MKKFKSPTLPFSILIFLLLFFSQISFSQIEKGKLIIGSTTGILKDLSGGNSFIFVEDVKFSLTLTPNFGYMISDKMMVGSQTSFSIENGDGATFLTVGLMPFMRVYLYSKKSTHLFAEQMLGVAGIHATAESLDFAFLAGAGFGVNYFLTENIALESTVRASFAQFNINRNLDYGIRFGAQLFFNRKNKR
ncbi:MAG: hypothetical protein AB8F94_25875 [Saprospiraceae bacterium]